MTQRPPASWNVGRYLAYSLGGGQVEIVSSKTQVSTDGLVRPRGLHVSVVFQRCDPQWPSLMETGTATFSVKQPGVFNWVDATTSDDWVVEPLRQMPTEEVPELELDGEEDGAQEDNVEYV